MFISSKTVRICQKYQRGYVHSIVKSLDRPSIFAFRIKHGRPAALSARNIGTHFLKNINKGRMTSQWEHCSLVKNTALRVRFLDYDVSLHVQLQLIRPKISLKRFSTRLG